MTSFVWRSSVRMWMSFNSLVVWCLSMSQSTHCSCLAPIFPLSMRFIPKLSSPLFFLIRTPVLASALHLLPFIEVLVDHEDVVIVEVDVVHAEDKIQGECRRSENQDLKKVHALQLQQIRNLRSASIAVATNIWWITIGTYMANPLRPPIMPSLWMIFPQDHPPSNKQTWSPSWKMCIISSSPIINEQLPPQPL